MESSVVPESAMESVNRTLANIKDMRGHLKDFLSLSDPQLVDQLPPLLRAQAHILLAKATTTLFSCILFLSFFSIHLSVSFWVLGCGFYLN